MMLFISGCFSAPSRSSSEILADWQVSDDRRQRALEQMLPIADEDWALVSQVAWRPGQSFALRALAVSALMQADSERLVFEASSYITQVEDWPMIQVIVDQSVAHDLQAMQGPLLLSLARPPTTFDDPTRPEWQGIAALTQQPVEQILFETLNEQQPGTQETRSAAWVVLARQHSSDELKSILEQTTTPSQPAAALRRAAEVLTVLPSTTHQINQLLAVPSDWLEPCPESWPQNQYALRHVAVLHALAHTQGVTSQQATQWFNQTTFHTRQRPSHGLAYQAITWPELQPPERQLARLLVAALQDEILRKQWFTQAHADRQDQQSEHGGLLLLNESGQFEAHAYAPWFKRSDRRFIAPPALIQEMPQSLAHYHFHAQTHNQSDYAGPGEGDLAFADRYGHYCLVLTFIDEHTLNVDLYWPGRKVLDLGVIHQP